MLSFFDKVAEGEWSVDEATEKIQSSNRKHRWKLTFKEGVNVNERMLKSLYKERIPEDIAYVARYDLTFRTPRWHQVRCKVKYHKYDNSRQSIQVFINIPRNVT